MSQIVKGYRFCTLQLKSSKFHINASKPVKRLHWCIVSMYMEGRDTYPWYTEVLVTSVIRGSKNICHGEFNIIFYRGEMGSVLISFAGNHRPLQQ